MTEKLRDKPVILHWIWSLSLGGDAKNLCALAIEQSKWASVTVLTRLADAGVRSAELAAHGITVIAGIDCGEKAASLPGTDQPVALIMHRNGRPDPVETAVLEAFSKNVPCFEFNTFGRADEQTDNLWSGHFFPSRTCLLQYARQRRTPPLELKKHCASGYAVQIAEPLNRDEQLTARRALGIQENAFVALRVQRPDLRKWDPLPVLAVKRLLQQGNLIQLIVQAAPPQRRDWVRSSLGQAGILIEPCESPSSLRTALAASDCFVNYAAIGETFGLAMAEAMSCGLPVLTNSTPTMDNAQIEICSHGKTGLVANSLPALTSALQLLSADPDYRLQLGQNARQYIVETFSPPLVEQRIRRFIISRLQAGQANSKIDNIPLPPNIDDRFLLDRIVLDELQQRTLQQHVAGTWCCRDALDEVTVQVWRWRDTMDYALSSGAPAVWQAVGRRLARASMRRN